MRNATLVYRSRLFSRENILSHTEGIDNINNSVSKMMDSIFTRRSKRVNVIGGKYHYTPSDEYKSYVIRHKQVK